MPLLPKSGLALGTLPVTGRPEFRRYTPRVTIDNATVQ